MGLPLCEEALQHMPHWPGCIETRKLVRIWPLDPNPNQLYCTAVPIRYVLHPRVEWHLFEWELFITVFEWDLTLYRWVRPFQHKIIVVPLPQSFISPYLSAGEFVRIEHLELNPIQHSCSNAAMLTGHLLHPMIWGLSWRPSQGKRTNVS